ncbi:ead/Ea22-like family protein [Leclercia adecarboxylata]|uniref:ead/Ea22-like family protein n=1 Tax=Leclercia adecarboxylata TaxID=83655 RepID=UPI001F25F520|nr:ead/Ea22-like family protein [Leclercia adecarboxylata]
MIKEPMTNKQALREAAEKATPGKWRRASTRFNGITAQSAYPLCGKEDILANAAEKRDAKFIAAANPATVLALLDELEAAEKRLSEITAPNMLLPAIDDLDENQLRQVIKTCTENYSLLHSKWETADNQIAELIAAGIITRIEG